jgi:hypothetical protein
LFGRKEKPELEVGEDPLEALRQFRTETTDHTNSEPN